jgi:hypothetical protein
MTFADDGGFAVLGLVCKRLITANEGAIAVILEVVRDIYAKIDLMNEWIWN